MDIVMKLVEKVFVLKFKYLEIQDQLFKLQVDKGDWVGVCVMLVVKVKVGYLLCDVYCCCDVVLVLFEVMMLLDDEVGIEV